MAESATSMIAKNSHAVLDRDDWYTNFTYFERSTNEILFAVSSSRQVGRWIGYIASFGISTVSGNRLSEMSVNAKGDGSVEIIEELYREYQRAQNQITPDLIKSAIKRNNWYIESYSDNEEVRVCSSGFRVHITVRKTPPL